MPVFLIEREFLEEVELSDEIKGLMTAYELDNEIRWLTSFLSADKKKTYCLYEVEDVEILRKHAADLGLPADAIVEVSQMTR